MAQAAMLLEKGQDVDARDGHGQTALMKAAHAGHVALVRLLVNEGAGLDHRAKYGLTALMLAVVAGHGDVVAVLKQAGANTTIPGSRAPFNLSPLEYAKRQGQAHLVAVLSDEPGRSPA